MCQNLRGVQLSRIIVAPTFQPPESLTIYRFSACAHRLGFQNLNLSKLSVKTAATVFVPSCREDGGVGSRRSLEEVELGEHRVEEVAGEEDIPLGAQSAAVGSDQEVSVPTQQARQPRRVHWRYQSPVSVTNTHTRSRLCRCYQPNRRPVLFLVLLLLGGASLAVLVATIAINATRELPSKMRGFGTVVTSLVVILFCHGSINIY
uniref:Uncharacterized protein n=1 Tax=Timema poppense TaxID=170557 RepID=A0A7R9DVQ1_TIMPO|nr:unnamed protein product [Timema poppensis]